MNNKQQVIAKRIVKRWITVAALLGLGACSPPRLELHGHVETIKHEGDTCWLFVDMNHKKYEIITPSLEILREGVQMQIRAHVVDKKTLCDLPLVIEVDEYKYDFVKDKH